MKKALLLLLVGFMALAPMTASASVRTEGMGVMAQQVEDLDLIWLFPQKIEEYSLVDYRMEFLGSDDEWGGVIHKDPYIGNWGLYVGRPFNGQSSYPYFGDHAYIYTMFGSIVDGLNTWGARINAQGTVGALGKPWWNAMDEDPENKLDLFKTFAVGDGVLGVRLNYASQKDDGEFSYSENVTSSDPDYSGVYEEGVRKSSVIGINVGYGLKDLGPFNALDLGLAYYMGSLTEEDIDYQLNTTNNAYVLAEEETLEGDGINEIAFNARAVKEASENVNLITNLNFRTSKLAVEYTRNAYNPDGTQVLGAGEVEVSTAEHKNTFIALGLDCNHKVNGGTGLVVGGLNLQYAKGTWASEDRVNAAGLAAADRIDTNYYDGYETEMTYMGIWANVGVEANLKSWLQVRAGFSRELMASAKMVENGGWTVNATNTAYQDTWEDEYSVDETEDTVMTFGVGVTHKNWNVDLLVTKSGVEDLLSDGDFGEGLLYSGSTLSGIVKGQIKYNF